MKIPAWVAWGALALGVVFVAVLIIYETSRRKEAGFMTIDGCETKWTRADFPLPVVIDTASHERIGNATNLALAWWRAEVPGVLGSTRAGDITGKNTDPVLIVYADWEGDQSHGGARPRFAEGTCKLRRVEIRIPGSIELEDMRVRSIAHELGHGLGLAHDPFEGTVMRPDLRWVALRLTEDDRKRLEALR